MDRFGRGLAVLKKHCFWVLCGLVVTLSLAIWWLGTKAVGNDIQARNAEIQARFGDLDNIIRQEPHPNQIVIEEVGKETGELAKEVYVAWSLLDEKQRANNPLPALSAEFQNAFNSLPENFDPEDGLSARYRQEYRDFINQHMPKLFEKVDMLRRAPLDEDAAAADTPGYARPPTGPGGAAFSRAMMESGRMGYDGLVGQPHGYPTDGTGEAADPGFKTIGIVHWLDYDRLQQRLNWPALPTTLEVVLAQEDLWVYEALLEIIKLTNGPVKNRLDAPVRQIQALQIGRDVAAAWRRGDDGVMFSGMGAGTGSERSMDGYAPPTAPPGADMKSGDVLQPMAMSVAAGRYVDEKGQPVEVDERGQPIYTDQQGQPLYKDESGQACPGPYKLMPIRMVLVMKETKLPKLFVECANSKMPVEVIRLDINPGMVPSLNVMGPAEGGPSSGGPTYGNGQLNYRSGTSNYSSGNGGYRGGSLNYSSDLGGGFPGGSGRGFEGYTQGVYPQGGYPTSQMPEMSGAIQAGTLDVLVEIQGIICIYNPPNWKRLAALAGIENEPPPEVDTLPAATPAAGPGPVAAPSRPPPAPPVKQPLPSGGVSPAAPAAKSGTAAAGPTSGEQPPPRGG